MRLSFVLVIVSVFCVGTNVSAFDVGKVNGRTLNYFLPVSFLELPCFTPIEFKGAYNSYTAEQSILGKKWTFNHNVQVLKNNGYFELLEGDGFRNRYTKERNLEEAKKASIQRVVIAQKKEDVKGGGLKSDSTYKELEQKLAADERLREQLEEKLIRVPAPLTPGEYYSYSRGPSTLTYRSNGTFQRGFPNGAFEEFNAQGKIMRSSDRAGNSLTYDYAGENLVKISDSCGRAVSLAYQSKPQLANLIAKASDSLGRSVSFEFSDSKFLTASTSIAGDRTEYSYDKIGNIIGLAFTPKGQKNATQRVEIKYNAKYEVDSLSGPGPQKRTYKRSFVANDKNHSITEIITTSFDPQKNRYTPVSREVNESKVKELEINTKYDGAGKEVSRESRKLSPQTGLPISVLDSRGRGELLDYDPVNGNLIRRSEVPSGIAQEFTYDKTCPSQVTSITTKGPDQKVKGQTQFSFDPKCNLKEASETKDGKKTITMLVEYNKRGKIAFLREKQSSKEVAFTYWAYGKPESITLKDVGTLFVTYRADGEIEKVDTFPHGKSKATYKGKGPEEYQGPILSLVRSTLDQFLNFLRPSGLQIGL